MQPQDHEVMRIQRCTTRKKITTVSQPHKKQLYFSKASSQLERQSRKRQCGTAYKKVKKKEKERLILGGKKKQNPRTHGTATARGPMLSILRADGKDSHPQKTTSWTPQMTRSKTVARRRGTREGGGEKTPTGERARTPSIPDNAFTAIATSPCKCSTGTKPSVRKDTFNVRPRLSLGRT